MDSKIRSGRNLGHGNPSTQSRVYGEQAIAESETSPAETGGRGLRSSRVYPPASSQLCGDLRRPRGPRAWGPGPVSERAGQASSTVCLAEI